MSRRIVPQPSEVAPINENEQQLVRHVRAGDAAAFERLFRMYFAAMLRFAISFVADADIAEDIVQEVFGRIWVQRDIWQPSTDVLSYLLAAVRNRALDIVTTEQRRATLARLHIVPNERSTMGLVTPADRSAELSSQRAVIWGVIHTLPEQRRTVLLLRWRYELEWEEISDIMGISVAAARMTHSRALQTLRERLPNGLE
jgi:RNA polymerase sigma-70 factor (ECF subfamily)